MKGKIRKPSQPVDYITMAAKNPIESSTQKGYYPIIDFSNTWLPDVSRK